VGRDVDNPAFEIRWGARAKEEVKKSKMLAIVANLYKSDAKNFKQQYDQVIAEEGEGAMEDESIDDEDEQDEDDLENMEED